jgi:hypothetical protein
LPDNLAGPPLVGGANFQGLERLVCLTHRIAGSNLRGEEVPLVESDQESPLSGFRVPFHQP